jgi:cytochrome P450
VVDVQEYVAALLERRGKDPAGDLISDVLTAQVDGELLVLRQAGLG